MSARFLPTLTPQGHLVLLPAATPLPIDDAPALRIQRAFEAGDGLFHLGAAEVTTPLPTVLAYWRDFARAFVAAVLGTPALEEKREHVTVAPPPVEALLERVEAAPPMEGGEYLSVATLLELWRAMEASLRAQLGGFDGTVQEFLARRHAAWDTVGRVHLHLAENPGDEAHPFAFLATYTTGLSPAGRAQHRPLGDAVRESQGKRDRDRLLVLLAPVHAAAEKSPLVARLIESGELFQPLAWTPAQAYALLKELPALEGTGVVVRVPQGWSGRRPPRAQVKVSIGEAPASGMGLDALLDFKVELAIDGEPLTAAELRALRRNPEGLVFLKGRWVEVDPKKLDGLVELWRQVEERAGEGVSFAEGMRLVAGAALGDEAEVLADREWTHVEAGAWLRGTLERLRAEATGEVSVPALRAELRPYQREGVAWLSFLVRLRLGACLADDMGLGKTVQVLALLLLLREHRWAKRPHLLVVPASLLSNWKAEQERFAPSLRMVVAHPSALGAEALAALAKDPLEGVDVVVTSYGAAARMAWLHEREWGLVVLDEAQAIKNPGTRQARVVKQLRGEGRVALTGTPVENRLGDLWSLFDFLNPGLLGGAKQFATFIKDSNSFAPVRALTRPYILRRLKTDRSIIADLPEKTELPAYCALTRRQVALYQETVETLAERLRSTEAGIERRGLVLASLLRLKQICNHPSQWTGDGAYEAKDSGKVQRLRELCEVIASRQEKVLVFSQFREMTGPLSRWLTELFGRTGVVLSGETAVKKRQELVRRFQEDETTPFFVLSLKAGGTGLNLTAAQHVIHFDRWWNPAVENQATDRAFRIGQRRNVVVHKFVVRGTIEERIDALLASKQKLATELLEGDGELRLTELADDELLRLVSLDLKRAREEG